VRKRNARGDRRHPHFSQIDENPAERAAGQTAQSRSSLQTVHGTIAEAMPDPVPKPPGRPPGEPIIIKNRPGRRRYRRSTGPWTKRTIRRSRSRRKSSPTAEGQRSMRPRGCRRTPRKCRWRVLVPLADRGRACRLFLGGPVRARR
jgi:hypothetical protein